MRVRDHKKKKKSARWHVYTSHFMPACVFAHVRRRLIAAISDYLGSLVGSLVATATPALLTLNKRPERLGERASERVSGFCWAVAGVAGSAAATDVFDYTAILAALF